MGLAGRGEKLGRSDGRTHYPRLTSEEVDYADRLAKVRRRLGRTATEFGDLLGGDYNVIYKLESGLTRIKGVHLTILLVLEKAVEQARKEGGPTPTRLWGPKTLTPEQRLAWLLRIAFPERELLLIVDGRSPTEAVT